MNEGGQSSTGQLIDFIITTHALYLELKEHPNQEGKCLNIVLCILLIVHAVFCH